MNAFRNPALRRRYGRETELRLTPEMIDDWSGRLPDGGDACGTPRLDLLEDDDALCLRFELPGVRPDAIRVEVAADALTVRTEREELRYDVAEECAYFERAHRGFLRRVALARDVDVERIQADYDDGVLVIALGKRRGPVTRIAVRGEDQPDSTGGRYGSGLPEEAS
jgi:HSP20 family protein